MSNSFYDYELNLEELFEANGEIDNLLAYRDKKDRKLEIGDDITSSSASSIVRDILRYNREDKGKDVEDRKPIVIYIDTNGGDTEAGQKIIDAIQSSITPVYTVNLSREYSMGFLIGLAGKKRFSMPNGKFLIHDGTLGIYNSNAKAKDYIDFSEELASKTKDYILDHTLITEYELDEHYRVEWYMLAPEAIKYQIIDGIVGVDCSLEDIL